MEISITDKSGNKFSCKATGKAIQPNTVIVELPVFGRVLFEASQILQLANQLGLLYTDATS